MGIPRGLKPQIDTEEAFNLFISMGAGATYGRVAQQLFKRGTVAANGKPFTYPAVWQAVWRYMARNPEKAKEDYQNYCRSLGMYLSDEEYYKMLSKHARTIFSPGQYKTFLKKNPHIPSIQND